MKRLSKDRRMIFICGCQKSGTSLLTALLDSHPSLLVLPLETKLFYFLDNFTISSANRPKVFAGTTSRRRRSGSSSDVLSKIIDTYDFEFLKESSQIRGHVLNDYVDVPKFFKLLSECNIENPSDIIPAICLAWYRSCPQLSKSVPLTNLSYVEKTPHQEEYAQLLKEWYPNSVFIHIYRNPYANAYSLSRSERLDSMRKLLMGAGKIKCYKEHVIDLLNHSFYFLERNKELIDDYVTVRYEDLVTDTRRELEKIASHIGIEIHENMFEPTVMNAPWRGNSRTSGSFEGLSEKPIDRFRKGIMPFEIFLVNKFLSRYVDRGGYEILSYSGYPDLLKPEYREGVYGYINNRISLAKYFGCGC